MAKKKAPKIAKTVGGEPSVRIPKNHEEYVKALIKAGVDDGSIEIGTAGAAEVEAFYRSQNEAQLKELWKTRDPGPKSPGVPQRPLNDSGDEVANDAAEGDKPVDKTPPSATTSTETKPQDYHRIPKARVEKLKTSLQNVLDNNKLANGMSVDTFLKGRGITAIEEAGDFAKAEALLREISGPATSTAPGVTVNVGKGRGTAAPKKPINFSEISAPLGAQGALKKGNVPPTLQGLMDLVGHENLPQGFKEAMAKAQGGDTSELLRVLAAQGMDPSVLAESDRLDPKVLEAGIKKAQAGAATKGKLTDLQKTLSDLKGRYVGGGPKSLKQLSGAAEKLAGREDISPETLSKFITNAKSTPTVQRASALNPNRKDQILDEINKLTGEMDARGPNLEGASLVQLKNRIGSLTGAVGKGDLKTVASEAGAAESAGFGLKQLRGSKLGKFLSNSNDPAVRKLLTQVEESVASGLGAGAESGMLGKLSSLVAKGGGAKSVGIQSLLMFLPLIMSGMGKLTEGASLGRDIEQEKLSQQYAPSVQSLLARYRAQQFAERGITSAAPDPEILKALQKMGPQLTSSEVYIGPDESMDHAMALRDSMRE